MRQVSQRESGSRAEGEEYFSDFRKKGGQEKNLRSAGGYAAGILFLAAAFLCAFFLPDYYSRWQDEQLLGQAYMEDRQMTHLPEEKDKPVAEKLRLLRESWYFEELGLYEEIELEQKRVNANRQEKLREQIGEWLRFGLLTEGFADLFEECSLKRLQVYACLEENGKENGLNLLWMQYEKDGEALLDFVMDTDGVVLYFVSCRIPGEEISALTDIWSGGGKALGELLQEESSFRLKEYCQADYIQLIAGADLAQVDGSSVLLLYGDFSAEAAGFIIDSYHDVKSKEWWAGYAFLIGSMDVLDLTRRANYAYGWEYVGIWDTIDIYTQAR